MGARDIAAGRGEGLRFLVVGGFAALLNWAVRFPLSLILPFVAAVAVANAIGMVFGFFAYDAWVFPGSTRSRWLRARDFVGVNLVGMAVVVAVSGVARPILLHAAVADAIAMPVAHAAGIAAGAVANFFGHKLFTYRRPA